MNTNWPLIFLFLPSSHLFHLHRSALKEDTFSHSNTCMNGSGSTTMFIINTIWIASVFRTEDWRVKTFVSVFFLVLWVDPPVHCEIAFKQTREQWYTLYVPLLVAKKRCSLAKINHDILLSFALQSQTSASLLTPPRRTLHIQISILYRVIIPLSFHCYISVLIFTSFASFIFLLDYTWT